MSDFDVERVRSDFPILAQRVHEKPLVYLDTAATAQKPRPVVEAMARYYLEDNANVHRGVHALGERATARLEAARERVREFVNAKAASEIVFVRGVTEAVNLVAQSFGRSRVGAGDEVLVTAMEHHSNLCPWQRLCAETGAQLRVLDVDERGELRLEQLDRLLGPRTRLFAVSHVSNVLGTINPVAQMVEVAHARGVPVLVDGAQAAPHLRVDVQKLGCDFYAFSSHKVYGPMGVGALYGRAALLEEMPPWQTGGEMVESVSLEKATWQRAPHKFEAGTPDVGAAVGLHAALDYLRSLPQAPAHEARLLARTVETLRSIPGLRLLGAARHRIAVVSFTLEGVHPHDIGTVLDLEGVAVRTGHLCAQPLLRRLGVQAVVRASMGLYTTGAEIDALVRALAKVKETFA